MVLTRPNDLPLPSVGYSSYYLPILKGFGENIALVDIGNEEASYTFSQVHDNSIKYANLLIKLGIGNGDVIALCCGNCAEYLMLLLAAAELGVSVTTCNPKHTQSEMIHQFNVVAPKLVIADSNIVEKLEHVSEAVTAIKKIATLGKHEKYICLRQSLNQESSVKEYVPVTSKRDISNTPFVLPFSSGTTGKPKAVQHSQAIYTAYTLLWSATLKLPNHGICYCIVPMFHMFGMVTSLSAITQGCKLIVGTKFEASSSLAAIEKYKITHAPLVPPMVIAFSKENLQKYDLSSMEYILSAAAPLPVKVGDNLRELWKTVKINQCYGMSEAAPLSGCLEPDCPKESVGRLAFNLQVKVVDVKTGKELGPNLDGELRYKGPQVFMGYYNAPEATRNSFDEDNWFRSGDIGHYDERGYIYIVDRLKDLIKYKGFQVSPAEIERVLFENPKIADAAVFGVPDNEAGELPRAFIVKRKESLTASEVHEYLKDRLSSYKQLRGGIIFRDSIPKAQSGKVIRRSLRSVESKL
uniref:4-coumarate--CoA ligase 1-like n=1 Tax=Ciona intestinalis TaxID=7719 RepID=UPI000180D0D9|nr:4-coumarate--CoA ligase 1-like [Ciona intestinalis]|eukprot:XP_018668720.1 4-coumarate--CoA ligase 1-like [Ciona intestinalis]